MALDAPDGSSSLRADRGPTLTLALALVLVIGFIDYATGTELRVYPLYFIPIAETSWRLGRTAGIVTAVVSSLMWVAANLLAGLRDSSLTVTIVNTCVQMIGFVVVAWLISANRSALDAERRAGRKDSLTGLDNTRAFYERAEVEVARARRTASPLVIGYLDLDAFKIVNDRSGHRAGDMVLATVGRILVTRLRRTDAVARLGGDEFAVLLPDTAAPGAQTLLDALRAEIAAEMRSLGHGVTVSIGAAVFSSPDLPSVDAMLAAADRLLYEAKRAGGDRLVVREAEPAAPPM